MNEVAYMIGSIIGIVFLSFLLIASVLLMIWAIKVIVKHIKRK